MIKTYEGIGGWTIEVVNGGEKTRFECSQYTVLDDMGTTWFDWDRAMSDAIALDNLQNSG